MSKNRTALIIGGLVVVVVVCVAVVVVCVAVVVVGIGDEVGQRHHSGLGGVDGIERAQ